MKPLARELGKPEEHPGIILEPIKDPVPREIPREIPVEPRKPAREPVPA